MISSSSISVAREAPVRLRVPLVKPDLPSLIDVQGAFAEVLENGQITNFGKYVCRFEEEVEAFIGAPAVSVSSGTMALLFSLCGVGVKPGDKVILPSFTFMATGQAVLFAGATPLFAEIDDDLNISPDDVAELLTTHSDVTAVIAVHMYGLPARAQELEKIVERASAAQGRKIHLIFDAAHAFGSAINGQRVGTFGDAEVFSLSMTKVLVSVEGGLVTTRNPELADRVRRMRNYGISSNYNAHFPGMNGKMSELHAIVGLHNLRKMDHLLRRRRVLAETYRDRIHRRTGFRVLPWPDHVVHTFKDFTVMVSESIRGGRDAIRKHLAERGVESRSYFYPPVDEQSYFRKFADRPLPRTARLSRCVITLPFYTSMLEAEIDHVVDCLSSAECELE